MVVKFQQKMAMWSRRRSHDAGNVKNTTVSQFKLIFYNILSLPWLEADFDKRKLESLT
jgi:hypothetical protein